MHVYIYFSWHAIYYSLNSLWYALCFHKFIEDAYNVKIISGKKMQMRPAAIKKTQKKNCKNDVSFLQFP